MLVRHPAFDRPPQRVAPSGLVNGLIQMDRTGAVRAAWGMPQLSNLACVIHGNLRAMGLAGYVGRTFAINVRGDCWTVFRRDGKWER